ncbi:hypothetical protein JCM3774_003214 [Rhodotorula dairenensis]
MAQTEQALLYALRSPTTPLVEKVQRATGALDAAADSQSLPPLVRDWAFDILLKATRIPSLAEALLDADLWALAARTTLATPSLNLNTPVLPVFVAFITHYAAHRTDVAVLRSAAQIWTRVAPVAMRKATVDAGLEGYEKLLLASLQVYKEGASTNDEERKYWVSLATSWLRALRNVVLEAGKGGKKVPSHTLSVMPKLLPLLATLPPSSPLRESLLQTVQLALFNLDNLRRGLARETYAAGGASGVDAGVSTADTELLAALGSLPPDAFAAARAALPALTHIYFAALAAHSTVLFPLPARSTFPTPSAQKSALEVLGLTKRRELAGRWVSGVLDYLRWNELSSSAPDTDPTGQVQMAKSLIGVLEEVEAQDLFRPGQAAEAWEGVFDRLVRGAVERLDAAGANEVLDAQLGVISVCARLAYGDVEASLLRIFTKLAQTSIDTAATSMTTVSDLLEYCIEYHSRSLTLPALLGRISDALATPTSSRVANNLLTSPTFTHALAQAIAASPSSSSAVRATWELLVQPVHNALEGPQDVVSGVESQAESPAKKRKRAIVSNADRYSAASRVRVLTLYVRNVADTAVASLSSAIRDFVADSVEEHVKHFAKGTLLPHAGQDRDGNGTPAKKAKKGGSRVESVPHGAQITEDTRSEIALGVEMLDFRYFAVERLRREDLLTRQGDVDADTGDWWLLRGKRREALRDVVEAGAGEEVVVAARVLLQHAELLEVDPAAKADAQATIEAVFGRIANVLSGVTWNGMLRGMAASAVGLALYESVSRRWLQLVDRLATQGQLADFSRLILENISALSTASYTAGTVTAAILRRSDFWELAHLRTVFLSTVRTAATVPSLATASGVMHALGQAGVAASKVPTRDEIQGALAVLAAVAAGVPREYLDSVTRTALADSALGLDLWISSPRGRVDEDLLSSSQVALREFVSSLDSASLVTADIASRLVETSSVSAQEATIRLCRTHLFEPAVVASRNDPSAGDLVDILRRFGNPGLSKLAKRFVKQPAQFALGTQEQAVLSLFGLLSDLGELSVPTGTPAAALVDDLLDGAVSQLDKLTKEVSAALRQNPTVLFSLEDAFLAILGIWRAQSRLRSEASGTNLCTWAAEVMLAALVRLQSFHSEETAPAIARVLLELLLLRAETVSRAATANLSGAASAFEPVLAYYLAFQSALPRDNWFQLDEVLLVAVAKTTASEYEGALQTVESLLSSLVTSELATTEAARLLDQLLSTMSILLMSGPEGSGRAATNCLADVVRSLAALVTRYEVSADALSLLLHIATFLETICGERPLLLSRLNTSSILSLVALCMRPTTKPASASDSTSLPEAGEIYCSFVAAVGHIVRHRKDHLVTLFPSLMAVISGFLSILRRSGLGTLGNLTTLDDVDAAIHVGQRAEREAKGSFPAWVWAGGLHAISRPEAKALGRLLGSLGSKTTSTGGSRRKHVSADEVGSTTSLVAPLSKHAPFLLLNYLRACVHSTCPIPSVLRSELQGGWFEVMDAMGKWEREALMKGLLGDDEEAERGILRAMCNAWEKERYRG